MVVITVVYTVKIQPGGGVPYRGVGCHAWGTVVFSVVL
jgi:hypothetical protein